MVKLQDLEEREIDQQLIQLVEVAIMKMISVFGVKRLPKNTTRIEIHHLLLVRQESEPSEKIVKLLVRRVEYLQAVV